MRQEVDTQFVLLILRYPAHSQILFFFQVHASIYAYFCIGFVLILFFFTGLFWAPLNFEVVDVPFTLRVRCELFALQADCFGI